MSRKKVFYVIEAKSFQKLQWVQTLITPRDKVGQGPTTDEIESAHRRLGDVIKEIAHDTGRAHAKKLLEG